MTKEEIIEMARQAGMMTTVLYLGRNLELLTNFAKLVSEKERERIFKQAPCDDAVQVSAWEFNMLTHQKDDMLGKTIAWAQWPKEEKNT